MLRKQAVILITLLAIVSMIQGLALASSINILNPSFELDVLPPGGFATSITGWTTINSAGIWRPSPLSTYYDYMPPGSAQVGFANRNGAISSQSQNLGALEAGIYTLKVYLGRRRDNSNFNYTVALYAGGTLLTSDSTNVNPAAGQWALDTLTYQTNPSSPIGQALEIRLMCNGNQINFDNVSLAFASVPIPGSLFLLGSGLAGLMFWRRRRNES